MIKCYSSQFSLFWNKMTILKNVKLINSHYHFIDYQVIWFIPHLFLCNVPHFCVLYCTDIPLKMCLIIISTHYLQTKDFQGWSIFLTVNYCWPEDDNTKYESLQINQMSVNVLRYILTEGTHFWTCNKWHKSPTLIWGLLIYIYGLEWMSSFLLITLKPGGYIWQSLVCFVWQK